MGQNPPRVCVSEFNAEVAKDTRRTQRKSPLRDLCDATKTEAVEQAIKATLIKKLGLDDLVTGSVTPQAFAYEVNRLAAAMLAQLGEIVGEDWYGRYNFPGAVLNFCSPVWMSDAYNYRRFAHLAPALSRS